MFSDYVIFSFSIVNAASFTNLPNKSIHDTTFEIPHFYMIMFSRCSCLPDVGHQNRVVAAISSVFIMLYKFVHQLQDDEVLF